MAGRFRYSVLYVPVPAQQKAKDIIGKRLPQGRGGVFLPRMEAYRRSDRKSMEVPIFPGYLFLYTDMDIREVHELARSCRGEMDFYLGEPALRERRAGDPCFFYGDGNGQGGQGGRGDNGRETAGMLYGLSDLDGEETRFLDMLREGDGLLSMSRGYEENRQCHVMEGPLKAFEGKIEKLDKHNRKAFLRFEVNGRQARAGFECRPKAHWFPEEGSQVVELSDGTEVDIRELAGKIMKI